MMKNKKAREDQAALSGRWSSHRKQPIKWPPGNSLLHIRVSQTTENLGGISMILNDFAIET